MTVKDYILHEKLYESQKAVVYKAERENNSYFMKIYKKEYFSRKSLNEMENEYEITKTAEIEEILKPVEVIADENEHAVVFEDRGGLPLNKIEFKNWEIKRKLELFYKVTEVLEKIHENKIIHKSLTLFNILYNEEKNSVEITGFGVATKLSREKIEELDDKNIDEITEYSSPEQTGRMNVALDYRADYYSLGAVFYEIFSGKRVFSNAESITELIYFHVAKEAEDFTKINSKISKNIWEIVKKLLAKNPVERYQSAEGIKFDIELCIKEEDSGKNRS